MGAKSRIISPDSGLIRPSRRSVLAGFAGIAGLSLLGDMTLGAAPAFAAAHPTSAEEMAELALGQVGNTLAQAQSSMMTDSPWHTYAGDWCAVFASWLTNGAGIPYETSSAALYADASPVDLPQIGDIIYYVNSQTAGHTGVVVDVVNGVASTVEGNTHIYPWQDAIVTHYTSPWGTGYQFARPNWSSGEDMPTLSNGVDSRTPARVLTANAWTDIYLDSTSTSRTFATDGATVDADLNFEIAGLGSGDLLQTRFVKGHGSGDAWTIDKAYATVDLIGTGAAQQFGQQNQKMAAASGSTYGLRAQIMSTVSGVSIVQTEVRWLEWD